jgi:hypothetical protein
VPTDPITVAADQALPTQLAAQGQRLLQTVDRFDLAQPRRQIDLRLDLVQQTARHAHAIGRGAEQAQVALDKPDKSKSLKSSTSTACRSAPEHGFHRQFPTCFDLQAFGQARAIGQMLITQPFSGAGARIEGGLLQGFQEASRPLRRCKSPWACCWASVACCNC